MKCVIFFIFFLPQFLTISPVPLEDSDKKHKGKRRRRGQRPEGTSEGETERAIEEQPLIRTAAAPFLSSTGFEGSTTGGAASHLPPRLNVCEKKKSFRQDRGHLLANSRGEAWLPPAPRPVIVARVRAND